MKKGIQKTCWLALTAMFSAKERANAVITIGNALLNRSRKEIAKHAIRHRLPSMYESEMWTDAGGLISYSTNDAESYRRAAWYLDKLLKAPIE